MPLTAQVNRPFEVVATDAPTGLVGTMTVEVYDPSTAAVILAPTVAGITEPRQHTYRMELTVDVAGTFSVRLDPQNGSPLELPLIVGTMGVEAVAGMVPNVGDIGDRLHIRTLDRGGNELGTFTADTRPNDIRVDRLIAKAYSHVTSKTGTDVPDAYIGDVRNMVEIYTAMLIELSHYSDQIRQGQSPYTELKKLFDEGMAALIESLGGEGASATDQPGVNTPNYGFPETSIGDGVMP